MVKEREPNDDCLAAMKVDTPCKVEGSIGVGVDHQDWYLFQYTRKEKFAFLLTNTTPTDDERARLPTARLIDSRNQDVTCTLGGPIGPGRRSIAPNRKLNEGEWYYLHLDRTPVRGHPVEAYEQLPATYVLEFCYLDQ